MAYNVVDGRELARISGNGKLNGVDVRVTDKSKGTDLGRRFNYLKLNGNLEFKPTVDTSTERQIFYVAGASGSGKSYFTR